MMNRRELAELASKTDNNQTKLALQADANLASLGARKTRAIRAFFDAMTPPKPKKPRKRHMTVARALKQAAKAGLAVNNVVVKPDGVELRLNEAAPDQPNPWHSI
jgi:hypothetical protein